MNDLLESQSHPQKVRAVALAKQVWPTIGDMPAWQINWLLGAVEDVIEGRPTPTLSHKERSAVKEAAEKIDGLGS